MADERFEKIFEIPLNLMKITGSHPDVKRDKKWLFQVLIVCSKCVVCNLLFVYTMVYDINQQEYMRASGNGALVVDFIIITLMYISVITKRDMFKSMFDEMKRGINYMKNNESRDIVLKNAYKGRRLTQIWLMLEGSSRAFLVVKSVVDMVYYAIKSEFRPVPFYEITYPKPVEEVKYEIVPYVILYITLLCSGITVVAIYVSVGALGPAFMLYACSQLELVKKEVELFYPVNGYVHEQTMERMKVVAKRIQDIQSFVSRIQTLFQYIYQMMMTAIPISFPLALYYVLQSYNAGVISPEFIIETIANFVIACLMCYYSEMLLNMSEAVRSAIYTCGWELRGDRSERTMILMLLVRMSRPLVVRALFCTMSFRALIDVFRKSYAIFNVLCATEF